SPDGKSLAVLLRKLVRAGTDPNGGELIRPSSELWETVLYDALTGEKRKTVGAESQDERTRPVGSSFDLTQADPLASFLPDGRLLAIVGAYGAIRICSAETGRELAIFRAEKKTAAAVAFSPDGKSLASVHGISGAMVWDVSKIQGK